MLNFGSPWRSWKRIWWKAEMEKEASGMVDLQVARARDRRRHGPRLSAAADGQGATQP